MPRTVITFAESKINQLKIGELCARQEKGNIKVNNGERVDWPHSFIFSNANFKISKLFINRKMQQQRNGCHTFVSYPFSFLLYAFDQRPLFGHHGVLIKTVEILHETKKYNHPMKVS